MEKDIPLVPQMKRRKCVVRLTGISLLFIIIISISINNIFLLDDI